jgi:hypothetical protein
MLSLRDGQLGWSAMNETGPSALELETAERGPIGFGGTVARVL